MTRFLRPYVYWAVIVWLIFVVLSWMHVQDSIRLTDMPAVQVWIGNGVGLVRYVGIPWLTALLTLAAGYVIGQWVLERLRVECDALSMDLIAAAIGLGIISTGAFLLGLTWWFWWMVVVPAALLGVIWRGYRRFCGLWGRLRTSVVSIRGWHWTECVLLALIVWYVVRTWMLTCYPATGWDECNSHLMAPKWYVENQRIAFVPWINFNSFPQHVEMLVTIQRIFTTTPGAVWPYLYHLGTLGVIWLLVRDVFAQRHFYDRPRNPGLPTRMDPWLCVDSGHMPKLLAILIYLALPMTTRFSQAVVTEPALVFYCSLLLWATFHFRPAVWGLIAGCALGVKYTAFVWVGLCGAVVFIPYLWWHLFYRQPIVPPTIGIVSPKTFENMKRWSKAIVLQRCWWLKEIGWCGVGLLIAAPWYIRNIVLFMNPVFPFMDSLFPIGHGTVPAAMQAELVIDHAAMLAPLYIEAPLMAWWTLTMADRSPWVTGTVPGYVGPWLLALVPGVILIWGRLSRAAWIAILVAGIYLLWLFGWERIANLRYGMLTLPVFAALSGVVVASLIGRGEGDT